MFNNSFITNPIIKQLEITGESILAFSNSDSLASHYTYITKQPKKPIVLDSIKDKKVETLTFNKKKVTKVTIGKQVHFYTSIDSTFVIGSHLSPIKNIIGNITFNDSTFQKLIQLPPKNGLTVLKNNKTKNVWTSVHIIKDDPVTQAAGILMERDTLKPLLSYFKGQTPQELTVPSIIPSDVNTATVFTYNDAELLFKNLRKFKNDSTKVVLRIAESFNEIAKVSREGESFLIAKSIDSQIAFENLEAEISEVKEFRNTTIYKFNSPDYFKNKFGQIIALDGANFMFEFNGYFIFCSSEISAENISSAIMSGAVLSKSNAYKDINTNLTRTITYCEIGSDKAVPQMLNSLIGETEKNINFKKISGYDLAIAQYTFENNFAHLNFVTSENSGNSTAIAGVSAPSSIAINETILGNPVYFSTRGNRKKSIAFQDVTNNLNAHSSDGTLLWSKKIDEPILGDIKEIDIKRNGRKQLAFVTKNKMFVVDENGKDVSPFPISYKDEITQPLAVFDYDNNRKYRFVIIQSNEVIMLDSKGKAVKGFTLKKAKSKIIATPQHIRLGNKDYLLFQEESGKLNILSRTGKERIKVSEKFKLNKSDVQKDGNSFVFITSENEQKTISQSGNVTTKKLNVTTDYFYNIDTKLKVSLNDNLLRVNGRLIELPFGIYTKPNLFFFNKTGYITVTESQENKVYVYDNNGTLINGFPVYGTSAAIITDVSKSKSLQVLVTADEKEFLLYTIN
ncbi:hypothetical protein ULMS_10550 [Patiriisocius marinistellae]|uniref:Uncharacterized protein n=2 Tax=Patiriisocius marinistellae TaxID=2494560 RepID=A0A5J4FT33_9FLAO|nr:hypothetical protein ULMS_10550 [Patiriisocius marinistellae]